MGGASACPERAKPFWGRRLAVCCAFCLAIPVKMPYNSFI
jgi:hypothetical protein